MSYSIKRVNIQRNMFVIFLLVFVVGCEEIEQLLEDEDDSQIVSADGTNSLTNSVSWTRVETAAQLEKLNKAVIDEPSCSAFISRTKVSNSGSVGIDRTFGSWSRPEIFLADNRGNKLSFESINFKGYGQNRSFFGDHNLIIECRHSEYGVFRSFVPKIGRAERLGEIYTPPWLWGRGRGTYSAPLWVSAVSELIYRVYLGLVSKRYAAGEPISDSDSIELLTEAKLLVGEKLPPSRPEDHDYYINKEFVFANIGSRNGHDGYARNAELLSISESGIKEQFRSITVNTAEVGSKIVDVLQISADLILGKSPQSDFEKIISVSLGLKDSERGHTLVTNPKFNGIDGWRQAENTSTSPDGYSNLSVFSSANRNTLSIELTSNILKDDGAIAHYVYQQIDVKEKNLDKLFLRANYSKLEGRLETGTLRALEDAAGTSAIFIEYLDNSEMLLGTSAYVNTEDPIFAGVALAQTPVALSQTASNHLLKRLPSIGNRGFVKNIGSIATRALGPTRDNVAYIRIYGGVGHYIGGENLRHWLGFTLVKARCSQCEASIVLHELDVVEY